MALTTQIKKLISKSLKPLGLKIDTLLSERRLNEQLQQLESARYFERPAFPIPEGMNNEQWKTVIAAVSKYRVELAKFRDTAFNDVNFTNANPFFFPPDSDVLYALIREHAPGKIVEIGSGNSTRLAKQAVIDGALKSTIISIDPEPRADIKGYADEIRCQRVEEIPAEDLANLLDPGDFLFIDSSHLVAVGNDCVYEFLQLIPRLKPGVMVHVHDVSLPYDYPIDWIRREPVVAAWAEQYLLQCLLISNHRYQVLWPGYYLQRTVSPDKFNEWFPNSNGQDAHSFWFFCR